MEARFFNPIRAFALHQPDTTHQRPAHVLLWASKTCWRTRTDVLLPGARSERFDAGDLKQRLATRSPPGRGIAIQRFDLSLQLG